MSGKRKLSARELESKLGEREFSSLSSEPKYARVLGIDVGTALLGYAFLLWDGELNLVNWGTLETPAGLDRAQRIRMLYESLKSLISSYDVELLAIERVFFSKNVKTAMSVSEVIGIILLLCAQLNLDYLEFTPSAVKKIVTGDGKADKRKMQFKVRELFKLEELPKPDDAADAIAIAYAGYLRANSL